MPTPISNKEVGLPLPKKRTKVLGIDPGLEGGLIILDEKRNIIEQHVMPIYKIKKSVRYKGKLKTQTSRYIDVDALSALLKNFKEIHKPEFAIIEKASTRPAQAAQSTIKTGFGYGVLIGLLTALDYKIHEVQPSVWSKIYKGPFVPRGASEDIKKKARKVRNTFEAQSLWGKDVFILKGCRKPHLGLVDASLIANYGLVKHSIIVRAFEHVPEDHIE